jgi:hypothetical protein
MKRTLLSLIASLAVAGTFAAAQESQQPSSQPRPSQEQQRDPSPTPTPTPSPSSSSAAQSAQKEADVTLTGCLVQGSSPTVFILENAKTSTDAATAKGKSYVIQAAAGTDLKQHLNHQVRIVGSEASMSGAGSSSSPSMGAPSSPGASAQAPSAQPASPSSQASSAASQTPSRQTDERGLPRLSARTVTMVANTCPAA